MYKDRNRPVAKTGVCARVCVLFDSVRREL